MPLNLDIIKTADGSHTIRDSSLDVTYHSLHGAITESQHVFIENGLNHVFQSGSDNVTILEIGFGTGLNCFLSWIFATENNRRISYTALEPYPVPDELIQHLNYSEILKVVDPGLFISMHSRQACEGLQLDDLFFLRVLHNSFDKWESTDKYDLVFLDAFGPKAAPELWSLNALGRLRKFLNRGASLVTFCAQGQFKRNLKSLGYEVESLPGPPGKREMVRAVLT